MAVFGGYSRYYNLFYRDKDYAGETAYVHDLIQTYRAGASSLLDLGCGTGQHALRFAGEGYRVAGVDRSEEMLAVARENNLDNWTEPDSPAAGIDYHLGDIREVRLEETFDVVVSLFHVISYQPENRDLQAVFATAREHLPPGGLFIFDCWYGPAVLSERPEVRVRRLEDETCRVIRLVEPALLPNASLVDLHYTLLIQDKASGAWEEIREVHRMRYLFRPEIELLLRGAGMALLAEEEWLTGRPLGCETWGACFVARREN